MCFYVFCIACVHHTCIRMCRYMWHQDHAFCFFTCYMSCTFKVIACRQQSLRWGPVESKGRLGEKKGLGGCTSTHCVHCRAMRLPIAIGVRCCSLSFQRITLQVPFCYVTLNVLLQSQHQHVLPIANRCKRCLRTCVHNSNVFKV